jgi:O-methyltransferase involved in polyketide biosynthesis
MNEKITIDLKGVPQTLLFPLIGRAKFSQESYSPIHDKKAIELVASLNYDFDKLLSVTNVRQSTLFWMARAYHFDEAIKTYLKKHPKAVIVNLGCGLDTTFYRTDNGQLLWIDIDLPDVIDLREKLLPPPNRVEYIKKSVLDFSWVDDIKQFGNDVFFFAGGFFMYFKEDQIKSIFSAIANQFSNANLIFDNISPRGLKQANEMLKKSNMQDALLQWGIYDGKELEAWSSKIKVVSTFPYFKSIKSKYNFPLSFKIVMYFFDFFHKSGIIHLKFI